MRKFFCAGSRNHEGRQKSNEEISWIRPGVKYARGRQLILPFKGAWNTFIHAGGCAFGLDWRSHLLAASCSFFDGVSHSISLGIEGPKDLGTNSTGKDERDIVSVLRS